MADIVPITNIRGPAARITEVTSTTVASTEPADVVMIGPDQNRKFAFKIPQGPRGIPGVNGVENDEAVAAYIDAPDSETSAALLGAYSDQDRMGIVLPSGSSMGAITLSALQEACDTAKTVGRRVWASGTLTTDQTLVIQSDADLRGLTINYTGTGVAVRLGSESEYTRRLHVVLPHVIAANKSGTGWEGVVGTTGVYAVNLDSCSEIEVPLVRGFAIGMLVYGASRGCAYNTFSIGHLDNNQINLQLSANASGWSNQNTFVGGRYSHNSAEGAQVAGARHIEMVAGLPNVINNNTWLNPSLEGLTPEYHVAFAGTVNVFMNARWEASPPRVLWQNGTTRCLILWGYQSQSINETFGTGASQNVIIASSVKWTSSGSDPIVTLEHSGSSTASLLTMMDPGARAAGASTETAYRARASATDWRFKRAADEYPRLIINGQDGRVLFGNGTADPTRYLGGVGTTSVALGNANLTFATDNDRDIGALGASRPRYVRAGTAIQTGAIATADLPTPAAAGKGAVVYDDTRGKLILSTGSAWRNVDGTAL
ncbi:hypothetical protein J7E45_16060 [Microbacterium sp. ISL-59]|uniref:hypothetical protein n=1 Tax=Microbacterium sp. ISL-59 TaxID=2819159 RepID=UPI001BE92BA9|nr:hypothetical protein [Microbacterium sp. ISL-59]MBT2497127.1 hypothetical protein [Microbacterium sp. ISL-59]